MSPGKAGLLALRSLRVSFQQKVRSESTKGHVTVAVHLRGPVRALGWGAPTELTAQQPREDAFPSLAKLAFSSVKQRHSRRNTVYQRLSNCFGKKTGNIVSMREGICLKRKCRLEDAWACFPELVEFCTPKTFGSSLHTLRPLYEGWFLFGRFHL